MTSSRAHKIEGFLSAVRRHGLYYDGMIVEEQTMAAYGDTEMTELGRSLEPVLIAMRNWGTAYARNHLHEDAVQAGCAQEDGKKPPEAKAA